MPKDGYERDCLNESDIPEIERMAMHGLTIEQIAHILGITREGFQKSMKRIPEIRAAIGRGRAVAVNNVSKTAYKMAVEDENPQMVKYWLSSRAGWAEKKHVEHSGKLTLEDLVLGKSEDDDGSESEV